jgi:CIC family chloride channel protein
LVLEAPSRYGAGLSVRTAFAAVNDRVKRTVPGYMLLLAVAIGLLAGYGAVGFRLLIHGLQDSVWATNNFTMEWIAGLPWFWVVGVPAVGGLIVGSITHWFAPEARGHGVPEVMEAVALKQGVIRPRVVVAKALASGVCIASGGSVGREGPIVQIGSAIGSSVGQFLRVGPRRMRTLVGCGAAAGIAATFNAPVAGALFAVEILLGDFGVPQFSPIVIASVAATVVSHHYLGDFPAFEIPVYQLAHPGELIAYVLLGVAAGVLSWLFVKTLYFSEDSFDEASWPLPAKAALGGALVGGLALLVPGVLGVGYESMNVALMEHPGALFLATMLGAKLLAVCITLGSGGSGGVFAPSLFLGSMLGALVGLGVHMFFPAEAAPTGAYALVGMGALVAATTHAPITAILIIFELTNDYRIMLPLMTSCIIATLLAQRLNKESIYTVKLMRRGVNVRAGQDIDLLRNIPVQEVMKTEDLPLVSPGERLSTIISRMSHSDAPVFYMHHADTGRLSGTLSMGDLRSVLEDADVLRDLVVAEDIADTAFPSVADTDTLDMVLQSLDVAYRDELPVIGEEQRLLGVVRIEDILARYRHELSKRQMADEPGDG